MELSCCERCSTNIKVKYKEQSFLLRDESVLISLSQTLTGKEMESAEVDNASIVLIVMSSPTYARSLAHKKTDRRSKMRLRITR